MKCINRTGTIGVAHELVDMTTPGFFCIITCCWLKCSKDGRKKWRGRRGGISINISKTEREKKINCDERRIPRRWQIKYAVIERYNHRTNYNTFLKIFMNFQITFEGWPDVGYSEKNLQIRIPVFRPLSSIFLHPRILELFYCTSIWRKKAETSQEDKTHEEKNLSVYKHYTY